MKRLLIMILAALLLAAGCSSNTGMSIPDVKVDVPPIDVPSVDVPSVDVPPVATGVQLLDAIPVNVPVIEPADISALWRFSNELMTRSLCENAANPVISPLSAYYALAMAANGAHGATLDEFVSLLGAEVENADALVAQLTSVMGDVKGDTQLAIANSGWADERTTIEDLYVAALAAYFDAQQYRCDLQSQTAIDAINKWVKDSTNGLIDSLHDKPYDESTAYVLLNTLYFKAKWQTPFAFYSTYDDEFKLADGTNVTVPFMHESMCSRSYIEAGATHGVLLPYNDEKTAFIALLPNESGMLRDAISAFDTNTIADAIMLREDRLMNLSLPKFETSFAFELNDTLKDMGLVKAFDTDADLSGIGHTTNGSLFISSVYQKVKLIVDEEGTEAAAVTEVAANDGCAPMDDVTELDFDEPFFYAVVDLGNGAVLFSGIMDNPA